MNDERHIALRRLLETEDEEALRQAGLCLGMVHHYGGCAICKRTFTNRPGYECYFAGFVGPGFPAEPVCERCLPDPREAARR